MTIQLASLTSESLIMLDASFEDRVSAIEALCDRLEHSGKLHDKQKFLEAVMTRESEGPTALGESLAVPHGKSEAVKEPVFACALLKDELAWQGLDGDEPVTMIFLLAIPPAQAGSTHMEVLTTLTSSLVEDEFRELLMRAKTPEQVMCLLGGDEAEITGDETEQGDPSAGELLARDYSDKAYPLVLLVGVILVLILFFML
ncbi:fructose PTS transporter subunit IIA [Dongshaea marina]|uniref:fructose PTS transporter subunit IIA n=1 Tax=Dongshaea marina TaxID=2047966 RepID=UPI0019029C8C|nr:fructose PTS transporter subunit IIA [Dongshaea marina]